MIVLWILAILGALGVLGIIAFVALEMWADREQRLGRNPFQ